VEKPSYGTLAGRPGGSAQGDVECLALLLHRGRSRDALRSPAVLSLNLSYRWWLQLDLWPRERRALPGTLRDWWLQKGLPCLCPFCPCTGRHPQAEGTLASATAQAAAELIAA